MSERAYDIKVDWDEDGLHMEVVTDEENYDFIVENEEDFYDKVKASVGPWLQEMYDAKSLYDAQVRAGYKWTAEGWIPEEEL